MPISAPVLRSEEVSVCPSCVVVASVGVADWGVEAAVHAVADIRNETGSATNVWPSPRVTVKLPLVTRSLSVEIAAEALFSPGPPGNSLKVTRMLPGWTSRPAMRDLLTAIASAMLFVISVIKLAFFDSLEMWSKKLAASLNWRWTGSSGITCLVDTVGGWEVEVCGGKRDELTAKTAINPSLGCWHSTTKSPVSFSEIRPVVTSSVVHERPNSSHTWHYKHGDKTKVLIRINLARQRK